jgi:CheY-like chemotaxis protein
MNDQAAPLVLLVDDEVLIHDLVEEALLDAGYRIASAHDGETALQLVESSEDLRAVITDIDLGRGPKGWDVAKRARQLHPQIAVVYVSGGNPQDWASEGVPNSVMVTKPFAPAQLVTAVSNLMNATTVLPQP